MDETVCSRSKRKQRPEGQALARSKLREEAYVKWGGLMHKPEVKTWRQHVPITFEELSWKGNQGLGGGGGSCGSKEGCLVTGLTW